nr:hypothetical protein [Tanacetum cinerariifolium]
MLAILDEHLLKFHACKDAKSLWEAIKNRFGGNKESKKMLKTILKHNYENFDVSSQEGLDKTYDSLPSVWNNISLIMRNKSDLDTLSMDDLYNNLKVYESEIKGQSSSSSNSQNVAFVSSDNTSNTNETVNTAHSLNNEDLVQINTDDLEEMDLKWKVAILSIRVKRFIKKTGRKLDLNGTNLVGFDMTKVECYNYHRRGHFARECRAPRNQGNRNRDALTRNASVDTSTTNSLVVQDGIGYQIRLESLEARIVVHEKNKAVYEEDIAFLKYDVQIKDISIKDLKNQLENALKEKDNLKLKLEKFETSSKNLTKLINSQISDIHKTGLGYDGHVNESELLNNVVDSCESDGDDNQVNDRFKKGEGYHTVPPPYTRNYMPPRADLSFIRLDNFIFKSKVRETTTSVPKIETNASKTSKDSLEKPKTVRSSAPIIEDWESYSEDENVFNSKKVKKTMKSSLEKIEFVNARITTVENENKAEKPRKFSQGPMGNKRNWNGLMTQRLRGGFEFKKKACFVCGSINHLIKDCDFYENKMEMNNKGKITGLKEIRPVWDNTARVNHQNNLTHPHPKRNFVPATVLTKSKQVPVNAAKQSSHRAATSVSTARHVNTAASRPKVNSALPTTYSHFKAHSPVRRPD